MYRLVVFGLLIALSITASLTAQQAGTASEMVVNPRISTDRSVDCSSIDRILDGLTGQDMSDEEKVLAVFNWTRRVLYHGDGPAELAFDFARMVHSLGNGSCLRQTAPMALLLSRLGYQSRSWVHDTHHLKIIMAGEASLSTVEITTHFRHNPFALPYLVPGENRVSFDADRVGALFRVEWAYAEGPGWSDIREAGQTFREPGQFSISVGGEKYPRNISLKLGVLP